MVFRHEGAHRRRQQKQDHPRGGRHGSERRTIARCWAIFCTATKPACGAIRPIAARATSSASTRRARRISPTAYRHRGVVDEAERAKNRTKSKVRARVEHPFAVIKRVFGFVKMRYRGLAKNAHRLFVTCALANLFMMRHRLLRSATP